MNTQRNRNVTAAGVGLILGNIFAALLGLGAIEYFNLTWAILFTILSLGIGLILLAAFFQEDNAVV